MACSTSTIALITGANQGIGKAIAIALAKQHGYTVIIGSRNLAAGSAVATELESQGHQATAVQLDLTSDSSIETAVSTIEKQYGRLDILINNAAIWLDDVTPALSTRELYTRTFDTNVIGTACLTAALVPLLKKANGGPSLIFVSSGMASLTLATDKTVPWYQLECTSYDASKVALNMVALNYVRLLEDVSGRVYVASPGLVSTNLTHYSTYGSTVEEGASHIVELATGKDVGNGTFTGKEGVIPW